MKRYAFEATGRWSQIHYVDAKSPKEARELFDNMETVECLDFLIERTGVKRRPDYDEDI